MNLLISIAIVLLSEPLTTLADGGFEVFFEGIGGQRQERKASKRYVNMSFVLASRKQKATPHDNKKKAQRSKITSLDNPQTPTTINQQTNIDKSPLYSLPFYSQILDLVASSRSWLFSHHILSYLHHRAGLDLG